jgi:small-conductance mechanosensitive channel
MAICVRAAILAAVVACLAAGPGVSFAQEQARETSAAKTATAASERREAREEAEKAAETQTWQTLLAGIEKDLDLRIRQTETLRRMLPDLKNDLGDALAKADNRLDQLLLLRGVAGETPWAFRSILIQLRELQKYVLLKRDPLDDRQARLAQAKKDFASIRAIRKKGLTLEYAEGTSGTLDAPLSRFRIFKKDLDEIKAEVDAALGQADQLQADITEAHDLIQEGFIQALTRYYFEPSDNLLTLEGWQSLIDDMREWAEGLPRFAGPLVTWVRWDAFFLYAACIFGLITLAAAIWDARRARHAALAHETAMSAAPQKLPDAAASGEAQDVVPAESGETAAASDPAVAAPAAKRFRMSRDPGWLLLFLGVGLYFAAQLTLFTSNQFVALGWVVLLSLGLMLLLSEGQSIPEGAGQVALTRRPIFVFFLLFALGALLQAVNTPGGMVGAAWGAACALASVRLYRQSAAPGGKVSRRLRDFATQAGFSLAIMVPISLAGFGPQCLIVVQAAFMLLLTLNLTALATRGLTALAARRPGDKKPGIALPFAQTVIYALYLSWILHYMGGPGFADHVMNLSLKLGVASITPYAVLALVVSFFLARIILSWVGGVLDTAGLRGKKLDQGLRHALKNIISYVVWLGFVLLALNLFGVPLHALAWIASGLSVGIGFGLKDIVNNFVSGLIIMFGGSVKKGDIIQQGKNLGEVESVSIRNTIIRTLDNTMVIIPNSSFLKGEIVNLSYQDATMRLTIPIAVAPGAKIKKVRKLLLEAAKDNATVLKKPKPEVNIRQFGRFGVEFDLYVWIDDFMKKFQAESDLIADIDRRFQENKIMMAFQGVKVKYKPRGTEEMQLEDARAALKEKRGETLKLVHQARRVHSRRRWNQSRVTVRYPE